ncbi:DUF1214 domain-containing protein [Rhodococcus qingshengii]|uniref:DUF1214 domain-containing protein n=1 Tax=Rhodococcus qingshengii TaxID=334542 RepID=UPI0035A6C0AC
MSNQTDGNAIERGIHRRAVETAVWGMAAVNYEIMRSKMAPEGKNEFLFWSGLLDWKNQTLTPNPDLIYYMAFIDPGRDGPMVIDIPAGSDDHVLNGSVCNVWQVPLEDVGKFGADEGRGARYLVLPPGYDGRIPEGYVVLQSDTNRVYALLRSVLPSPTQAALDSGLEYCNRIGIYPLAEADNPQSTARRDLRGQLVDTRIPYDIRYWEALDRTVQAEPWLSRDRAFAEMLKTIGIERGRPFSPPPQRIALLESAIQEAHEWLRELYEREPSFFESRQWFFPAARDFIEGQNRNFANGEVYPYTDRAVVYHMAFIGLKRLGVGQFYLVNIRDRAGNLFHSDRTYRMRVPAGVPVSQYWSVTMYDGDDHTFIRHATKFSVSSQTPGVKVNDDGSIDVYFGPKEIPGLESNSIATGDSDTFELMFRFYGVGPEVMSKEWELDDVDLIDDD